MKYCRHCGSELEDDCLFCPNCGGSQSNSQSQSNADKVESASTSKEADSGIVVGILAIVFSVIQPFIGLILTIVGFATSKEPSSKKLCKIALWIFLIRLILTIVLLVVFWGAIIEFIRGSMGSALCFLV